MVSGTATAVVEGVETVVREGESVDVPRGARHRLVNSGDVELVLIEVQRGAYTGEDDITRYEDDYGRLSLPTR